MPKDTKLPPAFTPEERENQLIALAMDQAEQMLLTGKAPTQVVVHYLKLASTKEKLNKDLLEKQVELAAAKTEAIQSEKRVEDMFANAISAMRSYGISKGDYDEDGDDQDVC